MALELRPNCEWCDRDLAVDSADARICTYECTFCAACVQTVLHDVCPNCGGGFVPRPIRPRTEWRPGISLAHYPAGTQRRSSGYSATQVAELIARVGHIAPPDR